MGTTRSSTALRIMTLIAWKAFAQVVSSLFLTPVFWQLCSSWPKSRNALAAFWIFLMLLLTTVLPSVVFRGSCNLEGIDFQLWIASLVLRGTEKFYSFFLSFCSELCSKGWTTPDLRDDVKITWIICFMIPLWLPYLEKIYIEGAQQTCAKLNKASSLFYQAFRLTVP